MPRQNALTEARNKKIVERFRKHRKANPKWTVFAVIEKVAGEFYLSEVTIGKILKSGSVKVPDTKTVNKYSPSKAEQF